MSNSAHSEEAIFLAALAKSRSEREAYLAAACGADGGLLARVRELLAAHDDQSGPLDATLPNLRLATERAGLERPGTKIGPYKLLQVIGEGGMGVVYMASQREPVERQVALKIIKPGMDSRQVIARFEAERQALALMDHPNIARVLDGGTTGGDRGQVTGNGGPESNLSPVSRPLSPEAGRPYFVMELVRGVPIAQYCDEHHLTPRQRLELFVPVCQAIQHAHQKGIIHRDVKPSNILVAEYDQQPVPKIIDFGVAKAIGQRLTEKTMFTEFGQVVGTIEYMSPEQAKLNQLDIDTRTDIYSLGVLLYELLSGETPFDRQRLRSAAFDEVLRIIREEEPPRPSTRLSSSHSLPAIAASRHTEPRQLASQLRGELDWIVMKALEKDRNRRYETANGLALDLLRYLRDEPVLACPPSAGYRLSKFARRNKRALITSAVFSVLLLGAIAAVASIGGWALRDRTAQQTAAAQRIALDRAERRSVLEREIEAALGEVALAYSHDRLIEAIAGQKRAASLWQSGAGDAAQMRRIEQWQADLRLAQRLDEIRLEQAAVKNGRYDRGAAEPAYLDAFRQYGLDVLRLPEQAMAERIRASAIADRLLPALDDWLEVRIVEQVPGAERLVAVAALADDDKWRNRLRQASLKRDSKSLLALAAEADVLDHSPASLLLLAGLLRSSNQLPAAVALLERAQQHNPVDFWLNQNLAFYLMQLPNPPTEKAIGFYRAAVTLRPTSPGVRVNLGIALQRLGRREAAEREFRTAVQLMPEYAEAHLNLGNVLFDQNHPEEAEREFLLALKWRPKYVKALGCLGGVCLNLNRLSEAESYCRAALAIDAKDVLARRNLGDTLLKLDRYADAAAAYRELIRLDGKTAGWHQDLAQALRLQGQLNEAEEELKIALRMDPRLNDSQTNLASIATAKQTPAQREAELRAGLQRNPRSFGLRQQLAEHLQSQGKDAEAASEFRELCRLQPTSGYLRSKVSACYLKAGQPDTLEAFYREFVAAYPKDYAIHLEYGFFLYQQSRLAEAERELRTSIACQPSEGSPHHQLARVLAALHRLDEVWPEYQAAIAASPNVAAIRADYAAALRQDGRAAESVAAYREAVRLAPTDPRHQIGLAEALVQLKQPTEAEAAFREGVRLDPRNMLARQQLATLLIGQGQLAEAEKELRDILRRSPAFISSRQSLIDVLKKQNKLAELETVYREALAQQPQEVRRYQDLCGYLLDRERPSEAEQVLRDAVAALPESAAAREALATFLRRQGQSAGADAELRQALKLKPNDASLHYRQAALLRQQGQLKEAVAAAREALRLNPHEPSHTTILSDLLKDAGQGEEAAGVLRDAAERRPEDAEIELRLARLLAEQKKLPEAEAAFREAIRRRPAAVGAYQELGWFLRQDHRNEAAADVYRELIRVAPAAASGHESLGHLLLMLGQPAEAEAELQQALALDPDSTTIHWTLGSALNQQNRWDEAVAAYREAVKHKPAEAPLLSQLGNALLKLRQYAEAEAALAKAAQLRPQDRTIQADLNTARNRVKQQAEERTLRETVAQNPADDEARFRLGNILNQLGRSAEAEPELREAKRLAPQKLPPRMALALALAQQGKLVESQEEYRAVLELQPRMPFAHFSLGRLAGRQGQWSEAARHLRVATEIDAKNHAAWCGLAAVRWDMGDVEGYRETCREMLKRFDVAGAQPDVLERTARACLLSSDAAGELPRAAAVIAKMTQGMEPNSLSWHVQFTKALAEFRGGNFAAAQTWLDNFNARNTNTMRLSVYAPHFASGQALNALVQHRLGQNEKAAAALAAARDLVEQWSPDPAAGKPYQFDWDDWLRCRILLREAEQTLAARP